MSRRAASCLRLLHFVGCLACLGAGAFGVTLALSPALHAAPPPASDAATAYKGAIVTDATTGEALFEDRDDYQGPPASMTKLMTFLVVHDALVAGTIQRETVVQVAAEDARLGGTQVWLDPRESFTVEELIYALLIQSANDAASALARATSGSVDAFVAAMNLRCRTLGMDRTIWRTPHGLPPQSRRLAESDLTTPRDMARLARELLTHTDVLRYTSIRTRPFGVSVRAEPVQMTNHNHLITRVPGVDGLKTGFTNSAGYCLTATAQRGGRRVIVVAMGSPASKTRDLHVTGLIDRGFTLMPADSFFTADPLARTPPREITPISAPLGRENAPAGPEAEEPADDEPPLVQFRMPPVPAPKKTRP